MTFSLLLDQTRSVPKINAREIKHLKRSAVKHNIHMGQLKLLLSELYPMTLLCNEFDTVVYIGAAPGTHLTFLLEYFMDKEFYVFDPSTFDPQLYNYHNITIQQCYADDYKIIKLKEILKDKSILFISDIRHNDVSDFKDDVKRYNAIIAQDMKLQQQLYHILRPEFSLLKFRLPFEEEDSTSYLEGELYYPVFGRSNTNESRLLVRGPDAQEVKYDHAIYNRHMRYFNLHQRLYENYDVVATDVIVREFMKEFEIPLPQIKEVKKLMIHACQGKHRVLF